MVITTIAPAAITPENPEMDRRITKKNILKKINKALKKVGTISILKLKSEQERLILTETRNIRMTPCFPYKILIFMRVYYVEIVPVRP